jgi:hypothetical protein
VGAVRVFDARAVDANARPAAAARAGRHRHVDNAGRRGKQPPQRRGVEMRQERVRATRQRGRQPAPMGGTRSRWPTA